MLGSESRPLVSRGTRLNDHFPSPGMKIRPPLANIYQIKRIYRAIGGELYVTLRPLVEISKDPCSILFRELQWQLWWNIVRIEEDSPESNLPPVPGTRYRSKKGSTIIIDALQWSEGKCVVEYRQSCVSNLLELGKFMRYVGSYDVEHPSN